MLSVLPFLALWFASFLALRERGMNRVVSVLASFAIALPATVMYGVLLGVITQATSR